MYKKNPFKLSKNRQDINAFYTHIESDVRSFIKPTSILRKGYTEREFWKALRRELRKYYSVPETRRIIKSGRIMASFLRQPNGYSK